MNVILKETAADIDSAKMNPDPEQKRSCEVRSMFGSIAPTYDLVNTVLSGGVHFIWRRLLAAGITKATPSEQKMALDLCSGTGALISLLQKRGLRVVATDFCSPMLVRSKENHPAVYHIQGDALSLSFPDNSFDHVTVAFGVRNFENLDTGLLEIKRVLKNGGSLHILEFGQPKGLFFGPLFAFYSKRIMPFIGGMLSGNRHAYEYLPKTSATFPCGDAFLRKLAENGYTQASSKPLTCGIAYIYRAKASK